MSSCVTGVPLPGWMFSAEEDRVELAVLFDDVAFAERTGDHLHHGHQSCQRVECAAGRNAAATAP